MIPPFSHFLLTEPSLIAQIDDVCLNSSNLQTLGIGQRVDDTVIHFLCALLNQIYSRSKKTMTFISPSVTQFIQRVKPEISLEALETFNIKKSELVFFPLSNLKGELRGHWSLLVWLRSKENKFLHFDSLKTVNLVPARNLEEKIIQMFGLKTHVFTNMKGPVQTNNVDCGVYLMATMDEIARTRKISSQLKQKINPEYINKFRAVLAECIIDYNRLHKKWTDYTSLL